jgi:hypothetical protein
MKKKIRMSSDRILKHILKYKLERKINVGRPLK